MLHVSANIKLVLSFGQGQLQLELENHTNCHLLNEGT
jgi:hypothetical protein